MLFTDPSLGFGRAVVNSVFYASVSSVLSTLCAAMGGYALAKFAFRANRPLTALVLASLIIPGPLLLAPGYQLIYRFGLLDSFWGLILPGIAPAFGVFLFRQALLHTVPLDLIEAPALMGVERSVASLPSSCRSCAPCSAPFCSSRSWARGITYSAANYPTDAGEVSLGCGYRPVKGALQCRLWLAHGWHGDLYCPRSWGSLSLAQRLISSLGSPQGRQRLERIAYDRATQGGTATLG